MVIRAPSNKDWTPLADITNHYIETGASHLWYRPTNASTLRSIYQMRDRHPWYVYEDDDGAVLGYAKSGPWFAPREEAYQRTCEVAVYVALHERCGFTRVGTFTEAAVKNNAWLDIEFWQKRLQ